MRKIFTSFLCGLISTAAVAQWNLTSLKGEKMRETSKVSNFYSLDLNMIRSILASASETGKNAKPVVVMLPTLGGEIEKFAVYSAPVVVKSIADRYQLGSYVGVGVDDPSAYVRFSVAPNDFQSMITRNGKYEFIEPQNNDKSVYGVHAKTKKSEGDKAFVCSTEEKALSKNELNHLYKSGNTFTNNPRDFSKGSDKKYRTMRLAMSVTGEYTTYFGGVAGAITQINATLTRCNSVFEMDFALRLVLQDFPQLIYTDPVTDPYSDESVGTDPDNSSNLLGWSLQLQNTLSTTIGNGNYDIGHLFGAKGGGGNAGCIGCVCIAPTDITPVNLDTGKGSAYTSPSDGIPQGDTFDIDYVAHEIGHQLGANHTFSMILENTGQNVEPGSGSTIMGYAGITQSTDVQQHSDAYFHINSIIQIQTNLASKTCDIETAIANNPPVISTMPDVIIPRGTAFVLTAQARDPENDPITYTWEQVDAASSPTTIGNLGNLANGPSFRSLMPTINPVRYFPKLSTVLAGNLKNNADWEAVSTVARTSNFRVTVRDNNADVTQKQTQNALQKVTVSANGPFKITSTKVYNNAPGPLTWDVVGTDAAPFNVTNVKIDYTVDNGANWVVLAASTPNDGSENVSFATFATNTQLKVRISAIGNVFYAIAPVTVSAIVACDGSAPAGLAVSGVTNATANVIWDPVANATYILRYKKAADVTYTEVPLTANSYTLTNLTEGTAYNVQVAAVCSGVTGAFAAVVNFTTTILIYCTAEATSTNFEKISNVTFATINNSSSSTAGYEDFTSTVGNVMRSSNYVFSATYTRTSYASDEVKVWIDFNQDKDFDDAGELVLVTQSTSPWLGNINIPADAKVGSTRMRVRLYDTEYDTNMGSCGPSAYGQVEDYTLSIGVLATNENTLVNAVQVYPNPAVDVLNVTKVSNNSDYAIYNVAGQLMSKGKVVNNQVQVSKLAKGVYMISIDNNGQMSKVKFLKK